MFKPSFLVIGIGLLLLALARVIGTYNRRRLRRGVPSDENATQLSSLPYREPPAYFYALTSRAVPPRADGDAEEPDECAICLAPLRAGEMAIRLHCNHQFHRQCILSWLATTPHRPTCPLCKQNVYVPTGHTPATRGDAPRERAAGRDPFIGTELVGPTPAASDVQA